jgi:uncharacterized protein YndB with AHSA1/START domain
VTGPSAAVEAGTVVVRVRVPEPPERVWPLLSEPAGLAGWLGTVGPGWPARARIELDEADHAEVRVRSWVPGASIVLQWRYLDLGDAALVRWSLAAAESGTEITFTDHDPGRGRAEHGERLGEWSDLAARLAARLATGEPQRDTPDAVTASVELPGGLGDLFTAATLPRWLPVAGEDERRPRWFFIVDADGPRRFPLTDWYAQDLAVTFSVAVPGTVRRTECRVTGEPEPAGLAVTHTGWSRLGLPDRRARLLRHRFAATWTASLTLARATTAPGGTCEQE